MEKIIRCTEKRCDCYDKDYECKCDMLLGCPKLGGPVLEIVYISRETNAKENFIIQYVLARAACTPSTPGIVKDAFQSWEDIQEGLKNEK